MRKIKKVIELYCNTSLSNRDIERACRLPSSTVNDYIKRFKDSKRTFPELVEIRVGPKCIIVFIGVRCNKMAKISLKGVFLGQKWTV